MHSFCLIFAYFLGLSFNERMFIKSKVIILLKNTLIKNMKIKLIYWNSDNFGDVLGPFIINHLSNVSIKMKYSSITVFEFFKILFKGLLKMRFKYLLNELFHRTYFLKKLICLWDL